MKKSIKILIVAVLVFAVMVAGFCFVSGPYDRNSEKTVIVHIESGSGTATIAEVLKDNEIIGNEMAFRVVSKLLRHDGKYYAGAYALSASMSMREIQKLMITNQTMANAFTLVEGMTVEKIANELDSAGIVSYEDFIEAEENDSFDYDFIDGDDSMYRLEGYLYPDTYSFDVGSTAHEVIDKMLANFDKHAGAGSITKEQLIIASIIEREAGIKEDMAKVSSVIHNRLDINMALQMDSIISYVLKEDKVNLSNDDTRIESDYNPYTNTGLPPGPICNPGIDAINAAKNPEDTDYLYFVVSSKLDGSAFFTDDYDEFLVEKEAYYKAYKEKYGE